MRRIVLVRPRKVVLEEFEDLRVGPKDCIVRVQVAAVCSLDARTFEGHVTRLDLGIPPVLGHEVFGHIIEPGATALGRGTPVAIINSSFCGMCEDCACGQVLRCTAFTIAAGGFADELVVPAEWCTWRLVPVEASSDPVAACYLDSIACAVRALKIGILAPGDRLLVRGGGFMGCLAALVGRAWGADVAVVAESERSAHYLSLLDLERVTHAQATRSKPSRHADVVVDVTGRRGLVQLVAFQLRTGGRLVLMKGGEGTELPPSDLVYARHLSIMHSFHSDLEDRREAVRFVPSLTDSLHLMSKELPLEEAGRALELVVRRAAMRCHLVLR
jgi:D-arabinose 1-dehydrogenase-like Zn-dependent alcohol dehydrogenase